MDTDEGKRFLRCVITGASRGIGRSVAEILAADGHQCVLVARSADDLDSVAKALPAPSGAGHLPISADLAQKESREKLVKSVQEQLGGADVLVNAAGIAQSSPLHKYDHEQSRAMMELNYFAAIGLTTAFLPSMREAGFGRVVQIASIAGIKGYPYVSGYCASKHALVGFTRAAAKEVAKDGVTINCVCPGYVNTPLTQQSVRKIVSETGKSESEVLASLAAMSPQGRIFEPEEIAAMVKFLVSDGARGVNGQALSICGGELG